MAILLLVLAVTTTNSCCKDTVFEEDLGAVAGEGTGDDSSEDGEGNDGDGTSGDAGDGTGNDGSSGDSGNGNDDPFDSKGNAIWNQEGRCKCGEEASKMALADTEPDIEEEAKDEEDKSSRVHIPDDGFEQTLIDLGYDDKLDDYVDRNTVENIKELTLIGNYGTGYGQSAKLPINDLTGLKKFKRLRYLQLIGIEVKKLDLYRLKNLRALCMIYVEVEEDYEISYMLRLKYLFIDQARPKKIKLNPFLKEICASPGDYGDKYLKIEHNYSLNKLVLTHSRMKKLEVEYNLAMTKLLMKSVRVRDYKLKKSPFLKLYYLKNSDVNKEGIKLKEFRKLKEFYLINTPLLRLDVVYNKDLYKIRLTDHTVYCVRVNSSQEKNVPSDWIATPQTNYTTDCK